MATSLYGFAVDKIFGCAFWTFLSLDSFICTLFGHLTVFRHSSEIHVKSLQTDGRVSFDSKLFESISFSRAFLLLVSIFNSFARSVHFCFSPLFPLTSRARLHTLSVILIQCVTYFETDLHRSNVCNGHSLCLKNCYFFPFLGNTKETCFISSFTQQQMCLFFR